MRIKSNADRHLIVTNDQADLDPMYEAAAVRAFLVGALRPDIRWHLVKMIIERDQGFLSHYTQEHLERLYPRRTRRES